MKKFYVDKSLYFSDPLYSDYYVAKLVNYVMRKGKKSKARKIVYKALDIVAEETKINQKDILRQAVANIAPVVEVRPKRIGGYVYQVPFEVGPERQLALSLRWLVSFAKAKKGKTMAERLAREISDAINMQGDCIKKKESIHKMAAANRAYAHFARY